MSVPVTSLHGHLYYAIKNACKCQDCRWARKQDKRDNAALHRSLYDFRRYNSILKPVAPPKAPKAYTAVDRDPRSAPKPGDVFEKAGRIRTVTQSYPCSSGVFLVQFKDSGEFESTRDEKTGGRSDRLTLPNWRKWAATANILEVAK